MARSRILRPKGPKRLTQWVRTDVTSGGTDFTSLAAGAATIDQTLPGVSSETIIRTRGTLVTISDQVASTELPFGAYGICIVSDQAVAIGVTAVPTPYTDADSDLWFVHGYWAAPVSVNTAVGFARIQERVDFDSKAMRRISQDETAIMVIENGNTSHGCRFLFNFAMLVKQG